MIETQESELMLHKIIRGELSYEQVLEYEQSLSYEEAIQFHRKVMLLTFLAKKLIEKVRADKHEPAP
jgi:hypothetical protein